MSHHPSPAIYIIYNVVCGKPCNGIDAHLFAPGTLAGQWQVGIYYNDRHGCRNLHGDHLWWVDMNQATREWFKAWRQKFIDWKDMLWNFSTAYFEYIISLWTTNKGMSWKEFKGEFRTMAGLSNEGAYRAISRKGRRRR